MTMTAGLGYRQGDGCGLDTPFAAPPFDREGANRLNRPNAAQKDRL